MFAPWEGWSLFLQYQTKYFFEILKFFSGAIAGNPFKIDRKDLAARLNFHHETLNSIDSIQSRDFICEIFASSR